MFKVSQPLCAFVGALLCVAAHAQTMSHYKFKDKFIDLKTLQVKDTLPPGATELRRETSHAAHFGIDDALRVERPEGSWVLNKSRAIVISDKAGKVRRTIEDPDIAKKADQIAGNMALFAVSGGVLRLIRLEGQGGYVLRRYSSEGRETGFWRLAHTRYQTQGRVTESIPQLYYFAQTDHEVIFSSLHSRGGQAVILKLSDGSQRHLDYALAGIITQAAGPPGERRLAGWVSTDQTGHKLKVELGTTQFLIEEERGGDGVKVVLADNTLYLAHYHNIATGCGLAAYDARSGKKLWRADVQQLNVGHSEYYNLVYLSLVAGRLILEANEAAGAYLQIFDPSTGQRLFSRLPTIE